MGNHYVPQELLKNFSDPNDPNNIWRYDKESKVFLYLPIKSVAMENEFYSQRFENWLSLEVESPANPVLNKLRNKKKYPIKKGHI